MPLLGGLLVVIFDKLFGAWADTLTRKAVIITTAVATITALTVAFVAGLQALATSLLVALPSGIGTGVWIVVPYNASACLGVIFAADSACAIYAWSRDKVTLAAQVAS